MNKKRIALVLVAGIIVATMVLMAIAPGFALAQYDGATEPGTVNGTGVTGGTTGGTTTGAAGTTGAEVLVFALAGAALIGSGYFLLRKSRA